MLLPFTISRKDVLARLRHYKAIAQAKGTYAGIRIDPKSAKELTTWAQENNIANPLAPTDMHITVMYARKVIPYKSLGKINKLAQIIALKKFGKNLVALLDSQFLHNRFQYGKRLGATWDFPEYQPHVTLSNNNDLTDADLAKLPLPKMPILLNEEYTEPLDFSEETAATSTLADKIRKNLQELQKSSMQGSAYKKLNVKDMPFWVNPKLSDFAENKPYLGFLARDGKIQLAWPASGGIAHYPMAGRWLDDNSTEHPIPEIVDSTATHRSVGIVRRGDKLYIYNRNYLTSMEHPRDAIPYKLYIERYLNAAKLELAQLTSIDAVKILRGIGLPLNSLADLKIAYHRWILKNHPDVGGNLKIVQMVNAAYDYIKRHGIPNIPAFIKVPRQPETPEETGPTKDGVPIWAWAGYSGGYPPNYSISRNDYTDVNYIKKHLWEIGGKPPIESVFQWTILGYDGKFFRNSVSVLVSLTKGGQKLLLGMAQAMYIWQTRGANSYLCRAIFISRPNQKKLFLIYVDNKMIIPPRLMEHESFNSNPSNDQAFMRQLPDELDNISQQTKWKWAKSYLSVAQRGRSDAEAVLSAIKVLVTLIRTYNEAWPSPDISSNLQHWAQQGTPFFQKHSIPLRNINNLVQMTLNQQWDKNNANLTERWNQLLKGIGLALKKSRSGIEHDLGVAKPLRQFLRYIDVYLRTDHPERSANNYTNIWKSISLLNDPNITRDWATVETTQETPNFAQEQSPIADQLSRIVQRITGNPGYAIGVDLADQLGKETGPRKQLYQEYLVVRRAAHSVWRRALDYIIRASGKSYIDYNTARQELLKMGLKYVPMPSGFDGNIGFHEGKVVLYTKEGHPIQGGSWARPDATITMNPDYNPEEEGNNYVARIHHPSFQNPQPLYTFKGSQAGRSAKWDDVQKDLENIRNFQNKWESDINNPNPKIWLQALMTYFLYQTAARVGSPGNRAKGVDTYGLSTCLSGDTLIPTENGLLRIDEIAGNRSLSVKPCDIKLNIIGSHGIAQADKWAYNGYKPIIKITTNNGYFIKATSDHKVLVLDGISLVWKTVSQLKLTDVLCINKNSLTRTTPLSLNLPVENLHGNLKHYNKPEYMTPELAYFMALVVSEGNVDKYNTSITNSDITLLNRFENFSTKIFGPNVHVQALLTDKVGEQRTICGIDSICKEDTYRVLITSRTISDWLQYLGIGITDSYHKRIPWSILQADEQSQLAYLAGYVEGDGSIQRNGNLITFFSRSIKNLQDVQIVLNAHGINSHLSKKHFRLLVSTDAGALYIKIKPYLHSKLQKFTNRTSYARNCGVPIKPVLNIIFNRIVKNNGVSAINDTGQRIYIKGFTEIINRIKNGRVLTYAGYKAGRYDKLLEIIKLISVSLHNNLLTLFNLQYQFSAITSIEKFGKSYVYDLRMHRKFYPAFTVNGIIVHNCMLRHLTIHGNTYTFDYVGKDSIDQEQTCEPDSHMATRVKKRMTELLKGKKPEDLVFTIGNIGCNSNTVGAYMRGIGMACSAHGMRYMRGTLLAREILKASNWKPNPNARVSEEKQAKDFVINTIAIPVAKLLGHKKGSGEVLATTCLKSYIDPNLFKEQFAKWRLLYPEYLPQI